MNRLKIYFVAEMGDSVFLSPSHRDGCMMDTAVLDTAGLLRFIEEEEGWHIQPLSQNERLCRYYRLAKDWLARHPENVIANSFYLSHFATAREMLAWRDQLKMARWNFSCPDSTSRLGALAGIEQMERIAGLPDRIINACDIVRESAPFRFSGMELVLQTDLALERPLIAELLQLLARHGAEITRMGFAPDRSDNLSAVRDMLLAENPAPITLDKEDDSLEIIMLETAKEHDDYIMLSPRRREADLMISANIKQLDNRMRAINHPTMGSAISSKSRIVNMTHLYLSLFDEHPHINRLLEWLTIPMHPLPLKFRSLLADRIADTGGFMSDSTLNIISSFLNGDFEKDADEKTKENETRHQHRRRLLSLYLPLYSDSPADNAAEGLETLAAWARQRIAMLTDNEDRDTLSLQLSTLIENIDTLLRIACDNGALDIRLAKEWLADIPDEVRQLQYPATVGATFAVESPRDIVSNPQRTLWAGLENGESAKFECDFLLPDEREMIAGNAIFWDRNRESRYRYACSILPVCLTEERLTLTFADKRGGTRIVRSPLITRLEMTITNFKDILKIADTSAMRQKPVERISHFERKNEYRFENADKIPAPRVMSPTALENFTMYPFDYMFEKILRLSTTGQWSVAQINTTKGNVAHATIARLFSPKSEDAPRSADEIREDVKNGFEQALNASVMECGALLLLPENKIEYANFKYRLSQTIDALLDTVAANSLRVVACERKLTDFVGLQSGERGDSGEQEYDLLGYVDMHLSDPQGTEVIFDLKWTGSEKWYKEKLEQNRSIQLAVYAELMKREQGNSQVKTGYFIMPKGRLLSCHHFEGSHFYKIERENDGHLFRQLLNSFRYRREQLLRGVLEECEDSPIDELEYTLAQEENYLVPLPLNSKDKKDKGEESTKYQNSFSNYKLFKGL